MSATEPHTSTQANAAAGTVRPAQPADAPALLALIRELADYERALHAVHASEADLRAHVLSSDGVAKAHLAERSGRVVGCAVWFPTFSTWTGQPGLHLEDLYVQPQARGHGLGRLLLAALAALCVERGWPRLEWAVLDWNTPAQEFYRALGAHQLTEWQIYRLSGDPLHRLARTGAAVPTP